MVVTPLLEQTLVLLEQVLVLLLKQAPVGAEVLLLLRVPALVRGQPLLAGLPPNAQPLASLLAELGGLGADRRPLAGAHHHVAAAAVAGVPADPRARVQGLRLRRAVAVGHEHPGANGQRYRDGRYRPLSFGTPRTPSDASHS